MSYMCKNKECNNIAVKTKAERCSMCGKTMEKVGFLEGGKISRAKKNNRNAQAQKAANKEKARAQKEIQKQNQQEGTLTRCKKSIGGSVDGNLVTLILEDEGIKLERKGGFTGRDKGFEEIKYLDITNIGIEKGFMGATIEIKYRGGKFKLPNIVKEHAEIFVNSAREKVRSTSTPKTETILSPMDEIKKAKELLDVGAITQEQFEGVRDKYLGQS